MEKVIKTFMKNKNGMVNHIQCFTLNHIYQYNTARNKTTPIIRKVDAVLGENMSETDLKSYSFV